MTNWKWWHTAALALIVAGICLIGVLVPSRVEWGTLDDPNHVALWTWLSIAGLLAIFIGLAGHGITGHARGALIDERNKMSLSRLQISLWTVLILSAYLAASLANIGTGVTDPLSISVPKELWVALGISTVSLVGSPLVLSTERQGPGVGPPQRTVTLLAAQGVPQAGIGSEGNVITYGAMEDAQWADLFRGDKTTNAGHLDLAKIQMFFFTVVLVLMYGFGLGELFDGSAGKITEFPKLDSAAITLLGISHAGYLTMKKVS